MKALICGLLDVPCGDAGAIRQHKLAIMCQKLGYEVLIVGLGKSNGKWQQEYEGVNYISLREGNYEFKDKVVSHLRYWQRLVSILSEYKPNIIIMDDLGPSKTIRIKRYCKKKQIQLIHDSVEWYSPEQFKHGKFSIGYLKKELLNRVLIDKNCRVIAISRYLQEYFQSRGCECVRIPVVISETDLCREKELPEDKVVFTYAGQPGKKDYLFVMLDAFAILPQDILNRVVFNIVGCTKEQMLAAGISSDVIRKIERQLVIYGRVNHDKVLEILKSTHYTLLIRSPNQRYAKAGFPTKVVESLSRSTPVICNFSSDLNEYLIDGFNSLIVASCSSEKLASKIIDAVRMTSDEREAMNEKALITAWTRFAYLNYIEKLEVLIKES